MIIFYGEEDGAIRGAKLDALKAYFKQEGNAVAMNMLKNDSLSGSKSEKEYLIVNAHGNIASFSGRDAEQLYNELRNKGLTNKRFSRIYLMACNVGEQAQDNSIIDNFAKEFNQQVLMNNETAGIGVYAPRGTLTYSISNTLMNGENVVKVTRVYIVDNMDHAEYTLDTGLLKVML